MHNGERSTHNFYFSEIRNTLENSCILNSTQVKSIIGKYASKMFSKIMQYAEKCPLWVMYINTLLDCEY